MQTPIQVSKREVGGVNIFTFVGAIDESNADTTFKTVFDNFIGNRLIFDLGLLTYGNSKFLGYLSKMNDFAQEKGGAMYLVNCVAPIDDVLEACGIFLIIPHRATVKEALTEMGIQVA